LLLENARRRTRSAAAGGEAVTFNRYVITVVLPNLILCSLLGKPALAIEKVARKVRLACGRRMERVMLDAPPKEKRDA
jgi:exopolysaccharide biosynthesis predicted pyruvyltransferase EpsI